MTKQEKQLHAEFIDWIKTHQTTTGWLSFVVDVIIPRAYKQGQEETEQWMQYQNMPADKGNP